MGTVTEVKSRILVAKGGKGKKEIKRISIL